MGHKGGCKNDDPNMAGCRSRNETGQMRRVRSDKTVGHVEEQYGVDIGRRSDMEIGNLMKEMDVTSQSQLLKKIKGSK